MAKRNKNHNILQNLHNQTQVVKKAILSIQDERMEIADIWVQVVMKTDKGEPLHMNMY